MFILQTFHGNHEYQGASQLWFQIRKKKHDWIFFLKEIISLHASVIYIESYLYKNEEFDHVLILHAVSFSL